MEIDDPDMGPTFKLTYEVQCGGEVVGSPRELEGEARRQRSSCGRAVCGWAIPDRAGYVASSYGASKSRHLDRPQSSWAAWGSPRLAEGLSCVCPLVCGLVGFWVPPAAAPWLEPAPSFPPRHPRRGEQHPSTSHLQLWSTRAAEMPPAGLLPPCSPRFLKGLLRLLATPMVPP